jgi:hypothetical protein
MIRKTFVETERKSVVQVTFTLPSGLQTETIHLVGDFNHWNPSSHPFQYNDEGKQSITLELDLGRAYQFRYLRNGAEWMHDSQADAFVYNPNSTYNFVVITDPTFKRYNGA